MVAEHNQSYVSVVQREGEKRSRAMSRTVIMLLGLMFLVCLLALPAGPSIAGAVVFEHHDGLSVPAGQTISNASNNSKSIAPILSLTLDTTEPSPSGSSILPDTGITQCYDNSGVIPCPSPGEPFYGQDAQYNPAATQPSYTNNGDDTVTDNITGLMWMQADDGVSRTWEAAINYCDDLSHSGHSDWRLPDKHELFGIVNFSGASPAIDPVFSSHSSYYWSGSQYASYSPYSAWSVYFGDGHGYAVIKSQTYYVRCVRSGP